MISALRGTRYGDLSEICSGIYVNGGYFGIGNLSAGKSHASTPTAWARRSSLRSWCDVLP
jgi:hypothetical protein